MKTQHGHGLISLNLTKALQHAPCPTRANVLIYTDQKTLVAGGINAKISRDDGRVFHHAGYGNGFRDEPVRDVLFQLPVIFARLHPQERRRDTRARSGP